MARKRENLALLLLVLILELSCPVRAQGGRVSMAILERLILQGDLITCRSSGDLTKADGSWVHNAERDLKSSRHTRPDLQAGA